MQLQLEKANPVVCYAIQQLDKRSMQRQTAAVACILKVQWFAKLQLGASSRTVVAMLLLTDMPAVVCVQN
jgi:hypothetical protein